MWGSCVVLLWLLQLGIVTIMNSVVIFLSLFWILYPQWLTISWMNTNIFKTLFENRITYNTFHFIPFSVHTFFNNCVSFQDIHNFCIMLVSFSQNKNKNRNRCALLSSLLHPLPDRFPWLWLLVLAGQDFHSLVLSTPVCFSLAVSLNWRSFLSSMSCLLSSGYETSILLENVTTPLLLKFRFI